MIYKKVKYYKKSWKENTIGGGYNFKNQVRKRTTVYFLGIPVYIVDTAERGDIE